MSSHDHDFFGFGFGFWLWGNEAVGFSFHLCHSFRPPLVPPRARDPGGASICWLGLHSWQDVSGLIINCSGTSRQTIAPPSLLVCPGEALHEWYMIEVASYWGEILVCSFSNLGFLPLALAVLLSTPPHEPSHPVCLEASLVF